VKELRSFKVILIVLALPLVIFGGWRLLDPIGFSTTSTAWSYPLTLDC
jgi:hypothetical protein